MAESTPVNLTAPIAADQLLPAIAESIQTHWEEPALSDFRSLTLTYGQLAEKIQRIHLLLRAADIKPGDRVCLCAKNSAAWAFTFLGTLTYGCVVVPLLHEFHPDTVETLVTHSEGRVLFTEKAIADKLNVDNMPQLEAMVLMPEFEVAYAHNNALARAIREIPMDFKKLYPDGMRPQDLTFACRNADELALINYTSGSTGNPKGVMLTYGNLWANISFGIKRLAVFGQGEGVLSMLPLAHMYGLAFEFLFPLCLGAHITFLGRIPSPKVVLDAFQATKPRVVITVPLVIEKIIKAKVFPQLRRPLLKVLTSLPVMKRAVYNKIKRQLLEAFGGQVVQVIIGGAAMSKEVEEFLRLIRFPFTIGYGMTECAPLITYEPWDTQRLRSCGRLCDGITEARIDSPDPATVPGTLYVKGPNVMKGYYKNPADTAAALDKDGWLNTGDICTMDPDGFIYINGRDKNMILSASGQNIYPEEIEVVLNNLPLVAESVVVDRDGKIVALVHPDYEAAKKEGLTEEQANQNVQALLPQLNAKMPAYSKVSQIVIQPTPFEKTPKQSIRRFLYK